MILSLWLASLASIAQKWPTPRALESWSGYLVYNGEYKMTIRDFPDHATFREKGAKLACADKLGVFLSLTLCNKAKFDPRQQVKYDGLEKM